MLDYKHGTAYDIGQYEAGFVLRATPLSQSIDPGGTVTYSLSLLPPDLAHPVALSVESPSPSLAVVLTPSTFTGAQVATLTVTDMGSAPLLPANWYSIPVTGTGGGFSDTVELSLLLGGERTYLPVVHK